MLLQRIRFPIFICLRARLAPLFRPQTVALLQHIVRFKKQKCVFYSETVRSVFFFNFVGDSVTNMIGANIVGLTDKSSEKHIL